MVMQFCQSAAGELRAPRNRARARGEAATSRRLRHPHREMTAAFFTPGSLTPAPPRPAIGSTGYECYECVQQGRTRTRPAGFGIGGTPSLRGLHADAPLLHAQAAEGHRPAERTTSTSSLLGAGADSESSSEVSFPRPLFKMTSFYSTERRVIGSLSASVLPRPARSTSSAAAVERHYGTHHAWEICLKVSPG